MKDITLNTSHTAPHNAWQAEGGCATVVTGSGDLFYLKAKQGDGSGADEGPSPLLPLAARQALLNGACVIRARGC